MGTNEDKNANQRLNARLGRPERRRRYEPKAMYELAEQLHRRGIEFVTSSGPWRAVAQALSRPGRARQTFLPIVTNGVTSLMVDTLEQFVALDVPFFVEERTTRVQNLKDLMSRADVAISEKYRRLLEAYQIEMEYGRTMSAYRQTLDDGRDAEVVRLGRVVLLYRVMEGGETGYWDNTEKRWVAAPESRAAIENALSIAKEEKAPDLIIVPVPAPQGARS